MTGRTVGRWRAAAGIAGPAVFTAAWVAATLRQDRAVYDPLREQLSGMAAADARDPWLMLGGFVALGAGTLAFAPALRDALGGRRRAGPAPAALRITGVALLCAAAFRRDRLLLGEAAVPVSWQEQVHDWCSGAVYGAIVVVPLLLAGRFRDDPRWRRHSRSAAVVGIVSGVGLAVFATRVVEPLNGVIQRGIALLSAAALGAVAVEVYRSANR